MESTATKSKSVKTEHSEGEDENKFQNVKTTTSTMNLINFYVVAMLIRGWLLFGEGNIKSNKVRRGAMRHLHLPKPNT